MDPVTGALLLGGLSAAGSAGGAALGGGGSSGGPSLGPLSKLGLIFDFLGRMGDRVESQRRFESGLQQLRDLWGGEIDPATGKPRPGVGDLIRAEGEAFGARQGRAIQSGYDARTQSALKFLGGAPDLGQEAKGLRRTQMAGVGQREQRRQTELIHDMGVYERGAQRVATDVVSRADKKFNALTARIDSNFRDMQKRLNTDIADMKGRWKASLTEFQESTTAAGEEAVADSEASYREAERNIDMALQSGEITPAQALSLKGQARESRNDSLRRTIRAQRTVDAAAKQTLNTTWAQTVGAMQSAAANVLGQMRVAGQSTIAQAGFNADFLAMAAKEYANNAHKEAATVVDMGWQVFNNMMAQTDLATGNNFLNATGQQLNWKLATAGLFDTIEADRSTQELSLNSTISQIGLQAIAAGVDIKKMIAAAEFGWQQTIIPMGAMVSGIFGDYNALMHGASAGGGGGGSSPGWSMPNISFQIPLTTGGKP